MAQQPGNVNELVEHLFRHEAGKLSATLSRAFGLRSLEAVEDMVQDTLMAALKSWSFSGVPTEPTAWLHRVARNKALDYLRNQQRKPERSLSEFVEAPFCSGFLQNEPVYLPGEIADSQLRMIYACCQPGIAPESQVAIILKTLCGFSVAEIASAFLSNEATIEKRLQRARKHFREQGIELEPPTGPNLPTLTHTVLSSLYLLFNEGYKRTNGTGLVQKDLCLEALRLALLVANHTSTRCPEALALVALLAFHAARFEARTNIHGAIVLLPDQDRSLWNRDLIAEGERFLNLTQPAKHISTYHIEATIQWLHCTALSFAHTNWPAILGLYNRLYKLKPTPVVQLHMAVPLGKVFGPEKALELLGTLPLHGYYLFHAVQGEMLLELNRKTEAAAAYREAIALTQNDPERRLLELKLEHCSEG